MLFRSDAEAKVNFRLLPGDTKESVIADVREIIADDQIKIIANQGNVISKVADKHAAGYLKITKALKSVIPDLVVIPGLLPASTDA